MAKIIIKYGKTAATAIDRSVYRLGETVSLIRDLDGAVLSLDRSLLRIDADAIDFKNAYSVDKDAAKLVLSDAAKAYDVAVSKIPTASAVKEGVVSSLKLDGDFLQKTKGEKGDDGLDAIRMYVQSTAGNIQRYGKNIETKLSPVVLLSGRDITQNCIDAGLVFRWSKEYTRLPVDQDSANALTEKAKQWSSSMSGRTLITEKITAADADWSPSYRFYFDDPDSAKLLQIIKQIQNK